MTLTALPPFRKHFSNPISQSTAAEYLAAYLVAAETNPALHPDAVFSGSGIQFSANGGQSGGLVLHNLRRVEKGLRGEWVAPAKVEEGASETDVENVISINRAKRLKRKRDPGTSQDDSEGWQDLESFQREQIEDEEEAREEDNFVAEVVEEPEVLDADIFEEENWRKQKKQKNQNGLDKEARKRAKKERTKAAQKDRERARKESH